MTTAETARAGLAGGIVSAVRGAVVDPRFPGGEFSPVNEALGIERRSAK